MPKLDASLTMLFNEVGLPDRFAAAARAGFKAVEIQRPYDSSAEQLAERLHASDLACVLVNMPAGDIDAGDRGIACLPGRESEFQDSVEVAIEYATALGSPLANCLAGVAPPEADADRLRATLVANLTFAADRLAEAGVGLVIEPLNHHDVPGAFLSRSAQTRAVIEEVGSGNVGLQYDVYHMQIMEGDLARGLEANLDVIRHVQISDNPGRNEPGTGEINFPFIMEHLDSIGYDGWVGCEYIPSGPTVQSLRWADRWLR